MKNVQYGSLFSQLLSLFNRNDFSRHVRDLDAEYRSKGFSCWDQFVSMLFCHLAQAKSLREITMGLKSSAGRLSHLGMSASPKRSTLSYANAHRTWELYERLFYDLLQTCKAVAPKHKFRFKNKLMSIDSSVIELCIEMFDWAKYRKAKGAAKLHLVLDHDGYLPVFADLTEGKQADVNIANKLQFAPGTIVVMDRGYIDYSLFERWTEQGVFFVTRTKKNTDYYWLPRQKKRPPKGLVRFDKLVTLNAFNCACDRKCKSVLRVVRVWVEEKQEEMEFITNNLTLAASTIAAIYKERWQIELFFKALKQNLKIKTFVGTSYNAVQIQLWTALICILLLKYLQFRSTCSWHLSNLVALLRLNLFTYRDLWRWISDPYETPPLRPPNEQPMLPGFDLGQHHMETSG
ncbi:IS4 family transposase [Pontiella sp.]|uniref:IS4 family transposase n=1 Tax=Pontiella sp. TaxID=2837462 RepID=UPI003567DB9B